MLAISIIDGIWPLKRRVEAVLCIMDPLYVNDGKVSHGWYFRLRTIYGTDGMRIHGFEDVHV